MPKYDFKSISSQIMPKKKPKSDISILLDGKNYLNESINTHFIKKINYSCPSGSLLIEGLFDLSKSNVLELISFKYLTITFSQELQLAYKQEFDTPKISINFKLLIDNEETIRKNIYVLKNMYKDLDTDYKSFIKFNMDGFHDINILETINKIEDEEKNNKFEFGIGDLKNNKKNFIEINDDIDDNLDEEEIDINNNKSEVTNFFQLLKNEKEKEEEKEIQEEENVIKKNSYIKVKDIDSLNLDNIKVKIGNKIFKKYLPSKKNKEEISKDLLLPMNFNNCLFNVETKGQNKEKIEFKNVFINDDLKELNEKYKKDIILDFLNLLIGHKNYSKNKNTMTIDDYTLIVLTFNKNIEKKISEINKNNLKEKEYRNYIIRLEKINNSLKLFHILFLNCFYSNNDNNYDENKNCVINGDLYDDFSSFKVQTMRKKRLIEWCMAQENNYINKTDLININKNKRKEILTRQIMSFGQIKTAIKTNKNRNLFINSKLSNLNEDSSNKTLSYFLKGQNSNNEINKSFISYKANEAYPDNKINNTWISFLLQSLLYKEKPNEYITISIKLIEEKMKDMEEISKPLIKGVLQLNYVLLKIYEKLINGIKDINDIEEYLNKLSENNLFGKNNTDHFCQYIISYLLAKVISIIIPELNKDSNSLYKKNYFLLNQIISEILSVDINDNNKEEDKIMNLIIIIKLLYVSNINSELKQKIFIEIISYQNLTSIESFWEKYNKENISLINVLNKEYINGIYYLNNNNKLLEAFKCFLAGKKYEYALDIYLKYFFSLIKEKQINQINFEEILDNLKEIYEKSPSLINDFYLDFIRFISYIVKKEETNEEEIIDLLKKFMYEYYGKGKIIYLDEKSHRFIIKELCDILIEKNRENKDLILCGDLRINEIKNVLVDDKCDLMDNILKDLIEHKNNQFSLSEY